MRYIAIDLGDKRTGLAIGDAITRIASPLDLIEIPIDRADGEALLDALDAAIRSHVGLAQADLVVGLPLNMDGTEGPRSTLVRAFAPRIEARTGRRVHLWDERLTSVAADERMARTGLTHKQKKRRRDALAAAAILESFLNADRAPEDDGAP